MCRPTAERLREACPCVSGFSEPQPLISEIEIQGGHATTDRFFTEFTPRLGERGKQLVDRNHRDRLLVRPRSLVVARALGWMLPVFGEDGWIIVDLIMERNAHLI